MSNQRITINGTRYDLSGMTRLDYAERENHGVSVTDVWYGPRSHRLIVRTYSVWQRSDGCCEGAQYAVYEPGTEDYGRWVERLEREGVALDEAPLPFEAE